MTAKLIGDNVQVPLTVSSWQTALSASLQSVHGQDAWWFQAWTPSQSQAQLTVQPVSRKAFDEILGLLQAWSESNRIIRFYWPERTVNWQVTISNATATLKPDVPVPSISLRLQLLSSWLSTENSAILPTGDNLSMIAGRMVHEGIQGLTASAASQSTGGAVQDSPQEAWSVSYSGKTCTITVKTGPHKGTVLRNVPSAQAAQYLAQGYSPLAFQALQELSRENSQTTTSGRSQDIWHETLGDIISQWL